MAKSGQSTTNNAAVQQLASALAALLSPAQAAASASQPRTRRTPVTRRATTATTAKPAAKKAAVRGKSARKGRKGNNTRGRVAGYYFASAKKAPDGSENEKLIFQCIQKHKEGITQKEIQEELELPHSTVWYALKMLQRTKVIAYKSAEDAGRAAAA